MQPCATWQMPPVPAAGASYTDPTYGTTSWRLAVPANGKTGHTIPAYSRVRAFNSDNTRMTISCGNALCLYDATTTPPTPISQIALSSTTDSQYPWIDAVDNDAYWSNDPATPNRIYFTSYSSSHGLDLRYVDVTPCTSTSNCTLTPQLIHTFSCTTDATSPLGAGVLGTKIETGSGAQGGLNDATDRYFVFSCDAIATIGRVGIDLIRYDRQTDTVTAQEKWYQLCPGQTPAGCKVTTAVPKGADLYRLNQHPNGDISVIWQTSSAVCSPIDSKWQRSCGTELFDPNFNYLGGLFSYNGHQDCGYDVHGDPVCVAGCSTNSAHDYRCLQIVNLNNVNPNAITGTHILLPCTTSYIGAPGTCESGTYVGADKSWHVSLTSWAGRPGWALLSTFMMAGPLQQSKPMLPAATTLGTAVTAGVATVTPANMSTIAPGVLSVIDYGTANAEMLNWTATTSTTATATFFKAHAATAAVQCVSCSNTGFGSSELLAVKIDDTAADYSPAVFYRIGRTHSERDGDYNAEAHASCNSTFTACIWGSSWDQDGVADSTVNTYWMTLAPPAPSTWNLNVMCSMTAGNPPTIGNCVGAAK